MSIQDESNTLPYVWKETANCIFCGNPPVQFSGHVRVNDAMGTKLTAGRCTEHLHSGGSDRFGCYGWWKPEMGVRFRVDEVTP